MRYTLSPLLLSLLVLFTACNRYQQPSRLVIDEGDIAGCIACFSQHEFTVVHRVDYLYKKDSKISFIGVTKANPLKYSYRSILLTVEGMIVFDAEMSGGDLTVHHVAPSIDSTEFIKGLLDDVAFIFFSPHGDPLWTDKSLQGETTCCWLAPEGGAIKMTVRDKGGWTINNYSKNGKLLKEVRALPPFVNTFSRYVKLKSFGKVKYSIELALIEIR